MGYEITDVHYKLIGLRKCGVMLITLIDHGCVILKFHLVLLILEIMHSLLLSMVRMLPILLLSGEEMKIVTLLLDLAEMMVLISVLDLFHTTPGDGILTITWIMKLTVSLNNFMTISVYNLAGVVFLLNVILLSKLLLVTNLSTDVMLKVSWLALAEMLVTLLYMNVSTGLNPDILTAEHKHVPETMISFLSTTKLNFSLVKNLSCCSTQHLLLLPSPLMCL